MSLFQNTHGNRYSTLASAKWRRGPGRGGAFLLEIPLSSILSPLVPRGERKNQRGVLKEPPMKNGWVSSAAMFA
jgi:hypothetical protein